MIDVALKFLRDELDAFMIARTMATSPLVVLTRLVDDAGKMGAWEESIGMSLINIEEERTLKEHLPAYVDADGMHIRREPELRLNLYVMFAANFKQYEQALMRLSLVMAYFQAHSVFTVSRHPNLDPRIDKLLLEIQTLSYEQLNQIWAFIGGKQLPCMMYKIRMVVLQLDEPGAVQPAVSGLATTIGSI